MKNKNSFLWLCLFISILFHIVILIFVPTLSLPALTEPRYTEVILVPVKLPLQSPREKPQERPIQPEALWAKGLELNAHGTLERAKKSPIRLPETFSLPPTETSIALDKLTEKEEFFLTPEVFQELIGLEESQLLSAGEMPSKAEKELVIEGSWKITGPASKRKVVFRPPPPDLKLKATIEIELKFWVLPDGAIGRIIPMRRGDPTLEREMMAYLKEWRFNPLPSDVSQEEQWGTLPIKYLLK